MGSALHVAVGRGRAAVLLAAVVLACLAGCEPAAGPGARLPDAPNNPVLIAGEFQPLFEAAGRTLRDHRFTIFREDVKQGIIVTDPLTAQHALEVWRSDAAGTYNQLEGSLHTILRSVEVQIWPACDAAGKPVPCRQYVEVRAYTHRLSQPERAFTAANQLPTTYKVGRGLVNALELEEEHLARPRPVFLRRDNLLEDWLMNDIIRISGCQPASGRPGLPSATSRPD